MYELHGDNLVSVEAQEAQRNVNWQSLVAKLSIAAVLTPAATGFIETPAAFADVCSISVENGQTVITGDCPPGTTVTGTGGAPTETTPAPAPVPVETTPTDDPTPTETDPDEPAAPAPKKTTKPKSSHTTSTQPRNVRHSYDFNMNVWGPADQNNDCGVNAGADGVSYALQRTVNPDQTKPVMAPYYKNGQIHDYGNQPYMSGAAPLLARHFGLEYKHVDSLATARAAIKRGAAVIFLAQAAPGSPVTKASHYVESDQVVNNNIKFHDPNQSSTRHFDKSIHSLAWMHSHGFFNEGWVLSPKHSSSSRNLPVVHNLMVPSP